MVVTGSDHHPYPHRNMANETPQELLRGKETSLTLSKSHVVIICNYNKKWSLKTSTST